VFDEIDINEHALCDGHENDYTNDDLYCSENVCSYDCVNDDSGMHDDRNILIPVFVNNHSTDLRDTGCFTSLIIDESLVLQNCIRYDQTD